MSRRLIAWIAIPLLAIAIMAIAGTIDPRKSDEKHLQYGAKFHCVARIECRNVTERWKQAASCVIISPRHALTAAHVVKNCDEIAVLCDDGSRHEVVKVIECPDFKEQKNKTGDLAVCVVKQEFSLDFYPALHGLLDEPGQVASIAGYGLTGTFETGARVSDGKKRAGSNVIDRAERDLLICSIDGHRRTELEFLIASGDSGGGLFLGNELAGINSFLMVAGRSPSSKYGEESAHTRISVHKDWIEEAMRDSD